MRWTLHGSVLQDILEILKKSLFWSRAKGKLSDLVC